MIFDFLKGLVRQRVQGVQAKVNSKAYGAQARAKSKVAAKFNNAVDGSVKAASGAAKKTTGKKKDKKPSKGKKDDSKMGLFGRDKKDPQGGAAESHPEPEAEFGDKTQFIQVASDQPKECVGWVVALSGPLKGQDFRLVPGKNVLGTAADSDIVLTDQYMSARHAVLRYEEGTFVLVDLDSTNGCFVNDERINKEELIDNDRLRLGRTEMKFKALE